LDTVCHNTAKLMTLDKPGSHLAIASQELLHEAMAWHEGAIMQYFP